MGQFFHEAVAIDPATGIAYMTEDTGPKRGFTAIFRMFRASWGRAVDCR